MAFTYSAKPPPLAVKPAVRPVGLVLFALREETAFAVKALLAGDVVKAHHAVAGLKLANARARDDHGSGELVAEDLRWFDVTLEDFFDVGAADATGGDFDEDFVGPDVGNRDFFNANEAFVAIDAGAHGSRDGVKCSARFRRCWKPSSSRCNLL
jgi:hypothetical protein